jgi:CBS domain-containing protein
MIALDLVTEIPALNSKDTIEFALDVMLDYHIRHLPVIDEDAYIGFVAERDLNDFANSRLTIGEVVQLYEKKPYISASQHVYDVLKVFSENNITTLPVFNSTGKYIGLISMEKLIDAFAETTVVTQPGGIIVLQLDYRDYSMATIARIVESENARILSSFVKSSPADTTRLEITLKINRLDLKHIIATFERIGYEVTGTYNDSDYSEVLRDRYDLLMNYIEM